MGNCASCIGDRRRDSYDEDDEAQRLFDENNLGYGSFDGQHMAGVEDAQEVQREIEALQRVVARTSDNMVDIYDIIPQDKALHAAPPAPYACSGQEPQLARYQTLLSKLSSHDNLNSVARVDWDVPDNGNVEMQQQNAAPMTLQGGEALVGNFADAAAAMR